MELRDIVPIILWPWFIVSMVILVRRAINRRRTPGDAPPRAAAAPPPATPGLSAPDRVAERDAVVKPPPDAPPFLPPGAPPAVIVAEGASIFDAPGPLPPERPRAAIAEMVQGIELPGDLTPLVGAERPVGAWDSAAFVTRSEDAATVGRAMGAELRRLGFDLATRHATEVVASRGDDWLIVAVHADAADLTRGGRPAFPGAGPRAVVVELWTE